MIVSLKKGKSWYSAICINSNTLTMHEPHSPAPQNLSKKTKELNTTTYSILHLFLINRWQQFPHCQLL